MSVIKTPGKFEGEESYVAYYWDMALEGCADDEFYIDDTPVSVFYPGDVEWARWPKLADAAVVCIAESNDGFVSAKTFATMLEFSKYRDLMESASDDDSEAR